MNNQFEFIRDFKDFIRVAKFGSEVFLTPKILEQNWEIYKNIQSARNKLDNSIPHTGDIVFMPNGDSMRIAHDWTEHGSGYQLAKAGSFSANTPNGHLSMSGSLDPMIKKECFKPLNKKAWADCWFFSQNYWKAHNGVYVLLEVNCFETTGELPEYYDRYKLIENHV